MSEKHPIIAVTGSSGAGTSTVKRSFESIFDREGINPVIIEGDSFHRHDRKAMKEAMSKAADEGNHHFSHFGADANLFDRIEELFQTYGESGQGQKRYYLHSDQEAEFHNQRLGISAGPGEFTPWEDIAPGSDLMFYEGLHGLVVDDQVNVAQHVDLGIGVVPIVNLEWIQKIFRDNAERGYSAEAIVDTILRRMPDYVNFITPQFGYTDINFQRVPTVDTSNPFIARAVPTPDESFVVISFKDPKKFGIDFPALLNLISDSFLSDPKTIVVPGGKMSFAMELILGPIIHDMLARKH